ncbi:hypothetical protein F3Y22_tig00110633pilonHSYRG00040 [Hibiscus syriacus]|uniref:Nucleotide-diphospho-sugar transferase domain-containing protein n=2 Tax=Hibiscus syriacus TaxID=106335 RepID=A0A6A3A1L9_HIBSY|nr:hypothetical protein F3Y22_tig00110633pilonHSYRG00040 [Hibiscus syriacus]
MIDRTVILTVVNETWAKPASILDLFLESFRIGEGTERLLNHLLIVAEDSRAFQYCNSKHPHCFKLENLTKKLTKTPPGTQGSLMFSPTRLILLTQVIEFGYNVVFTNADVMWLRNPLSKLVPNSDLSIGCELYPIDAKTFGIKGDGGFFHLKANARTFEFIRTCNLNRVLYPDDSEHQSLCKISEKGEYIGLIGVEVSYFNEEKFGRLCLPCDLKQILTVQANCCENIDSKIHDMKLVLDDWRNFVQLSANNVSSKQTPSSWRAPEKCITGIDSAVV